MAAEGSHFERILKKIWKIFKFFLKKYLFLDIFLTIFDICDAKCFDICDAKKPFL